MSPATESKCGTCGYVTSSAWCEFCGLNTNELRPIIAAIKLNHRRLMAVEKEREQTESRLDAMRTHLVEVDRRLDGHDEDFVQITDGNFRRDPTPINEIVKPWANRSSSKQEWMSWLKHGAGSELTQHEAHDYILALESALERLTNGTNS